MSSKIVSSLADESRRYWPPGVPPSDNKPPDIEMAGMNLYRLLLAFLRYWFAPLYESDSVPEADSGKERQYLLHMGSA